MRDRGSPATRRLWELRQFPIFAATPIAELALLADNAAEVAYPARSTVATPGPARALELVLAGEVTAGGRVWGAREIVGLPEVLAHREVGAPAIATRPTRTLQVTAADLDDVLEEGFDLQRAMLHELAQRVRVPVVHDPAPESVQPRPLGLVERLFALRRIPPLRSAHVDAVAALAHVAFELASPAGTELATAGERATRAHVLLEGRLRIAESVAQAGTVVGGIEILGDLVHRETVTAATRVRTLSFDAQAMFDVFEDHPELGTSVLTWLAGAVV